MTGPRLAASVEGILASRGKEPGADQSSQERQVVEPEYSGRKPFQYLTRQPKFVVPPEPAWEPEGPSKPWSNLPALPASLPFEQQVEVVEAKEEKASRGTDTVPDEKDLALSIDDYFDVVLPVMLRWKGAEATELKKRVRFRFMDAPDKYWTINLYPPEASVTFQSKERADLTIDITTAQFRNILDGRFDARKAIADGEIALYGDLSTLKSVGFLFSSGGTHRDE